MAPLHQDLDNPKRPSRHACMQEEVSGTRPDAISCAIYRHLLLSHTWEAASVVHHTDEGARRSSPRPSSVHAKDGFELKSHHHQT